MNKNRLYFVLFFVLFFSSCRATSARISGQVLVDGKPYHDATVRIQATDQLALTDQNGSFSFEGLPAKEPILISAWAPGYYIAGGQPIQTGTEDLVIELHPLPLADYPDYEWLSAFIKQSKVICAVGRHVAILASLVQNRVWISVFTMQPFSKGIINYCI